MRLRACWATHHPVGCAVTPARCTRRLASSITNSTYMRWKKTVSTVKKSQARIPAACWRRNDRQLVGVRLGAGSRSWARSTLRIELADTRTPRRNSSPWDALVAPPWILAGEPDDDPLHLAGDRRSAGGGSRVGPAPADHTPVPTQQSLGSYQKDRPSYPWEQPAQRREQRTVGGLQAGPWILA